MVLLKIIHYSDILKTQYIVFELFYTISKHRQEEAGYGTSRN